MCLCTKSIYMKATEQYFLILVVLVIVCMQVPVVLNFQVSRLWMKFSSVGMDLIDSHFTVQLKYQVIRFCKNVLQSHATGSNFAKHTGLSESQ